MNDRNPAPEYPVALSVVVPLLNESESLVPLYEKLRTRLESLGRTFELIFVDDGSTDGSFEVLSGLHRKDSRVSVIRFRRNYGKSAALSAGFAASRGELVFTMDADLQDDPEEIPQLIDKLNEGYDLVSGWKFKRLDPLSKRLPSKLFNLVTSWACGLRLHDFNCGFKLYRGELARSIKPYGELHRYLPALAHWRGYRVGEVKVRHHKRPYGRTKFGMGRFLKGYLDLLTVVFLNRYIKSPLHFFGTLGTLLCLVGFSIGCYFVAFWLRHGNIGGRVPFLLFAIFVMLGGIQLISTGLLGEMLTSSLDYVRAPVFEISAFLEASPGGGKTQEVPGKGED